MYQTTRRQNAVDRKLDIYRHINLEYQIVFGWFSSVTPEKFHEQLCTLASDIFIQNPRNFIKK